MFKLSKYDRFGHKRPEYDVVVVGSGPNGLAAAITMQKKGLSVLLLESHPDVGGGLRAKELTLPGFTHDVCSAIYPLLTGSVFFKNLALPDYAFEMIEPPLALAHPFDDGNAAFLASSVHLTAQALQRDCDGYLRLMLPLLRDWRKISDEILGPFHFPSHMWAALRFGRYGFRSVLKLMRQFKRSETQAFIAGLGAHAMLPLSKSVTAAFALILALQGHINGWPFPRGGAQQIADALLAYFISLGGQCLFNFEVRSLSQLPSCSAVLFDVTPKQLLSMAGDYFSPRYRRQLGNYRYGMGVFKIDYALSEPVPFVAEACKNAGTVHLGNSACEIENSEKDAWEGRTNSQPFVILAQPSLFDGTRAPVGKHTLWAYCHVPAYSKKDMTGALEKQIERFAPGFRDCILARHIMRPSDLEAYNANYVGGDINGGAQDFWQLFSRPALRLSPYRTSKMGFYLCSSSTPPGGGVHGLCGYYAANRALKDIFNMSIHSPGGL